MQDVHLLRDKLMGPLPLIKWPTYADLFCLCHFLTQLREWNLHKLSTYFGEKLVERIMVIPRHFKSTVDLWFRAGGGKHSSAVILLENRC